MIFDFEILETDSIETRERMIFFPWHALKGFTKTFLSVNANYECPHWNLEGIFLAIVLKKKKVALICPSGP